MYLTEVFLEKMGPIEQCHVKMPFSTDGLPLPLVLAGPNGSGKSTFLSYVADALFEFGKPIFRDFVSTEITSQNPFFRIIGPLTVSTNADYSLALLQFKRDDSSFLYREKSGRLDPAVFSHEARGSFASFCSWPTDGADKQVKSDARLVEEAFTRGSYCFFPATRRELPAWMNPLAVREQLTDTTAHLHGYLYKPLYIETCLEVNLSWILDVFLDSLVDLVQLQVIQSAASSPEARQDLRAPAPDITDFGTRVTLRQSRTNVERILQGILQDPGAKLTLNLRQVVQSRISVKMGSGRIIPSLRCLSDGQLALLNIFLSVIRYSDRADIRSSLNLNEISGIVMIDEADAHLHSSLQHDCLPKLMQLFPKIQFILTAHSHALFLGMEKVFGAEGFRILHMPEGMVGTCEGLQEFALSLSYYNGTRTFEDLARKRMALDDKPLVLTEGQLDPEYIRTAVELLDKQHLLTGLDIEFVGSEDQQGARHGGKDGLNHFRNVYLANPWLARRHVLLLYDCDSNKPSEDTGYLSIRAIPKNETETKARAGIENLFPPHLFEQRFYTSREKEGTYGEINTIQEFDKKAFCTWICTQRRDPHDFIHFGLLLQLLEDFLSAAQSPS